MDMFLNFLLGKKRKKEIEIRKENKLNSLDSQGKDLKTKSKQSV
jgi:hypothetical protein